MEEHVAIDSTKQKKFVKSLKGIKKLMKETGALPEKPQKEKKSVKDGKIKKKKLPRRGLVYLSHIPHGFYEHEMTEYFKQFGMVTNARVIRSKRTGRSKGHAFVEFKDIAVAEVVAETMNNYLMGKRLIKAVYIPPKDQRLNAKRKNWNTQYNPGRITKLKMKKTYNAKKTENEDMKIAQKLFNNLTNTKNKLKEIGIDYDFFTPVDVPEGLMEQIAVKKEKEEDKKEIVDVKPNKKKNKSKVTKVEVTYEKNKIVETKQEKSTKKEKKQKKKDVESNEKITAVANKNNEQSNGTEKVKNKKNKKENIKTAELEINKRQKLKEAGVKPLEDYISIVDEVEDDDSDSSYHFDSDEYDNELNEDSDAASDDEDSNDDETDEDDGQNNESDVDDSDREETPVQKNKKSKKGNVPTEASKPKVKHVPFMELMKRKLTEKVAESPKKPKFMKQNNKKLPNKQLKKKK